MVYTLVVHFHAKEGKDIEEKVHNKLVEASQTYMKDAEVIGWHVMQDHVDTRKWTIVERYERESSLKIHQANPYYAEFGVYMGALLDQPLEIHQFNELDTSKPVHVDLLARLGLHVTFQFSAQLSNAAKEIHSNMVYTIVCHLYAKEGKEIEEKIHKKLLEASSVYTKDKGTLNWHVMQDHADRRKWTIVERYEKKSSLKIHVSNPFYATFGAYMAPLLAKKLEIRQFNELDKSRL